jgi:hypothetical protein
MKYNPKSGTTELQRLRRFYRRIAYLTRNHDVIRDTACVTADKLGAALERVNPKWLGY